MGRNPGAGAEDGAGPLAWIPEELSSRRAIRRERQHWQLDAANRPEVGPPGRISLAGGNFHMGRLGLAEGWVTEPAWPKGGCSTELAIAQRFLLRVTPVIGDAGWCSNRWRSVAGRR